MKIRLKCGFWLAASTCTLLAASAWAQPPGGELVKQDFENGEPGWLKFGEGAQVGISREAEDVHGGAASLQFNYTLQMGGIAALALANQSPLAASNTLSFWAKADKESTMTFAIKEVGGGTWIALFNLPTEKWQRVELNPADFTTGFGTDDTPDADGKLSLDKIEWAGIADFAQFILQEENPAALQLFGVEPGPRTLWLDDVAFDPAKTAAPAAAKALAIDNFVAPHLAWIHLAGTDIKRAEKPVMGAPKPGIEVSYTQGGGKLRGVARRVNAAGWAGTSKLTMQAASQRPVTLAVQLEEKGGGKFFVPFTLAGDGEPTLQSFSVSQFQPSQDSKDVNGTLDVDQVQQILVLDLSGFNANAPKAENTLWLGDIKMEK